MIFLKNYIFSIGCHSTRPPLSSLNFLSSSTLIQHRIPGFSSECLSFMVSSPRCSYICNSSLFLICWCLSCPSASFHKNVQLLIYLSEFRGIFSHEVSTSTGPIHFFTVRSFRRLKNILEFDSTMKIILRNV